MRNKVIQEKTFLMPTFLPGVWYCWCEDLSSVVLNNIWLCTMTLIIKHCHLVVSGATDTSDPRTQSRTQSEGHYLLWYQTVVTASEVYGRCTEKHTETQLIFFIWLLKWKCLQKMKEHTSESWLTTVSLLTRCSSLLCFLGKSPAHSITAVSSRLFNQIVPVWSQYN